MHCDLHFFYWKFFLMTLKQRPVLLHFETLYDNNPPATVDFIKFELRINDH